MARIFNQLRRKYLNSKEMKKYLGYAFGEIILVMIGILLALQINNWNAKRQTQKEIQAFMSSIEEDIQRDIKELNELLAFKKEAATGAQVYLSIVDGGDIRPQTFGTFLQYNDSHSVFDIKEFQSNTVGFDMLKESGKISSVNDKDLLSELYAYYSGVKQLGTYERSSNQFIMDMNSQLFKSNAFREMMSYVPILQTGQFTQEQFDAFMVRFNDPGFYSANVRIASFGSYEKYYGDLIQQGESILSQID